MGIKFFDFDNDGRPDLFITDMHSDMFETVPPEREKQKAAVHAGRAAARRPSRARSSSAMPCSTTSRRAADTFEEISDRAGRRELLAVGPEHRGRERGRLGGHLHRVEHGLSAPIRHQLDAVEQPRREVPRCRVPARHRAAPRRPDAHAVVRRSTACRKAWAPISAGAGREDQGDGPARQPIRGDLRPGRRRRSRHRHQRFQFRAAGARQRPVAAAGRFIGSRSRWSARRRTGTGSARPSASAPAVTSYTSTTTASPATSRRARCRSTSASATPGRSMASRSIGRRDASKWRRSDWRSIGRCRSPSRNQRFDQK